MSVHPLSAEARTAILESAGAALVVTSHEGRIVLVNQEAERLFGMARDELVGESIEILIPPRLRRHHAHLRIDFPARLHGRGIGVATDLIGLHKDGTEIPLEIGLNAVELHDRRFVIATIVDMRRLKSAEESLRRANAELQGSEARYRGLIDASIQGIVIVVDGTIRLANPAVAELLLVPEANDLIGRGVFDFIAPQDRPVVERNMRARLAGEPAPARYALRLLRADGELRWVDCLASVVQWDERPAVLAAIYDINEQRRAEQALRDSEERFRQLAENVKEAFVIADLPDGRLRYVSPAFEDIWGRTVADAYQDPTLWFNAIHPEDQPQVRVHQQANLRGRSTAGVFRVIHPDGTMRFTRYRMFPVLTEDGAPYRLVGLVEDITEQRTQEEQLRQAQKMEAIGQLAGGIAHDFNNLLTAIVGYSELVMGALEPSHPAVRDLNEVIRAGQSAAALTQRILAFSRRQVLQPRVIDLNLVLRHVEPLIRRLIGEDILLVMKPDATLMRVFADPGQIEQIVMNLAVNSRDAMPDGGRLTIETSNVELGQDYVERHPGATDGQQVMLAVSDTGIGMDKEVQRRVFEPFFTTKGAGKGTGLGLATVFGIVKQSGGSIWVYSEPGLGTTFKIFLPIAKATIVDETPAARIASPLGTETVLVVEDQMEVRSVVSVALQRHGYHVLEATNGGEAVGIALQHQGKIHLLLTDVVMPEMDGRQLARTIKDHRPDVRVLYTSGYTDDVIVRHGILDADLAFLQKPFTPETLLKKVRAVLDAGEDPAV